MRYSTQLKTRTEIEAFKNKLFADGESLLLDIFEAGLEIYEQADSLKAAYGTEDVTGLINALDEMQEDNDSVKIHLTECDGIATDILLAVEHLEDELKDKPKDEISQSIQADKIAGSLSEIREAIENIYRECA